MTKSIPFEETVFIFKFFCIRCKRKTTNRQPALDLLLRQKIHYPTNCPNCEAFRSLQLLSEESITVQKSSRSEKT